PPSFPLPFSSLGLAPLLHVGIGHAERADGFDAEGVALLLREAQPPRQGGRLVPDRIVDDVAGDRFGPLMREIRHPPVRPGNHVPAEEKVGRIAWPPLWGLWCGAIWGSSMLASSWGSVPP